jgi:hypothetical protein
MTLMSGANNPTLQQNNIMKTLNVGIIGGGLMVRRRQALLAAGSHLMIFRLMWNLQPFAI